MIKAQILAYEKVAFTDIYKKEINLAALFLDSSKDNEDVLDIFTKFEKQYKDVKFYIIDKQDATNEKLFATEDFLELPQLFVLHVDELVAEPLNRSLTEENVRWFFDAKFLKLDNKIMTNLTSGKQLTENSKDAYVVYTNATCQRCINKLNQVNKAAQVNKIGVIHLNCSKMTGFCEKKGVYNFPTLTILINKTETPLDTNLLTQIIEQYEIEKKTPHSQRVENQFQAQYKPTQQRTYEPLKTDLKQRVSDLESRIKRLEEVIKKQNKQEL